MRLKPIFVLCAIVLISGCAVFIPGRIGPAADITVELTPERVALGKKLAEGIMACGACHTTGAFDGNPRQDMYLAGDKMISKMEGRIAVPNITQDKETGIGAWTDGEILRALTKGLSRDKRVLFPAMPWANYGAGLTDEEALSVVAYLRTVPAVNNSPEPSKWTMLMSLVGKTGMVYNMFAKNPFYIDYVPSTATAVDRGLKLAYLGACVDCHANAPGMAPKFGEPLAGGIRPDVPGRPPVFCANLTPDMKTGIGSFTDEELYDSIKYGKRLRPRPNMEMVRWPMMPRMTFHTTLTDDEIAT